MPNNYHNDKTLIQYVLTPDDVVKQLAEQYLEGRKDEVYTTWTNYSSVKAAYDAIIADPSRPEHTLKAMAAAVTNEKTVRLHLTTGEQIRAEAAGVKRMPYNYDGSVSSFYIIAADRLLDERKRPRDIVASEIVSISHGSKTLWTRKA